MGSFKELYRLFKSLPFPLLGKKTGDFPEFDSAMANSLERYSQGERGLELPEVDNTTLRMVKTLRRKPHRTTDEEAFLTYYTLLEDLHNRMSGHRPQ